MSFAGMRGQDRTTRFLRNAIESRRLSHSYIFQGFDGTGRGLLAKNFAKAVNCENGDSDACEACASCRKIEEGRHHDVLYVAKDEKGKIGIESVRRLSDQLALSPFEARWKVAIVADAHVMTESAANAFLKTLEEPPPHSIIILITLSRHRLLPTIASRCQVVTVPPVGKGELVKMLTGDYGLPASEAAFLARFSEGRLGKALANRDSAASGREDVLAALSTEDIFDDLSSLGRDELCDRLAIMAGWYRDLLVANVAPGEGLIINTDREDVLNRERPLCPVDDLQKALDNIIETRTLIRRNVAVKLALGALIQGLNKCTR